MRWDYLGIFSSIINSKTSNKEVRRRNICPNCEHHQDPNFLYCPECGQHSRDSKITFFSLIKEVFANILNLDGSLYKSFLWLPIPAYLSKKYVRGERKQYLNPVRFFFFAMLLLFALLVGFMDFSYFEKQNAAQRLKIERSEVLKSFENEVQKPIYNGVDTFLLDSIRKTVFKGVVMPELDIMTDSGISDSSGLFNIGAGFSMLRKDFYYKPIEEIISHQENQSWFNKTMEGQIIRVTRDVKGALTYIAGNGIWVFVAMIFFLSFVMKALYIRKGNFLIEHSILLFHTHAFAFAVGIIFMLLIKLFPDLYGLPLIGTGIGLSILYFLISMKYYYQQGWLKTIFKFIIISIFYFIFMLMLIGILFLLSIIFFR